MLHSHLALKKALLLQNFNTILYGVCEMNIRYYADSWSGDLLVIAKLFIPFMRHQVLQLPATRVIPPFKV